MIFPVPWRWPPERLLRDSGWPRQLCRRTLPSEIVKNWIGIPHTSPLALSFSHSSSRTRTYTYTFSICCESKQPCWLDELGTLGISKRALHTRLGRGCFNDGYSYNVRSSTLYEWEKSCDPGIGSVVLCIFENDEEHKTKVVCRRECRQLQSQIKPPPCWTHARAK